MKRCYTLFFLLLMIGNVHAALLTEVIELKHRNASDLVPVLKPLVEPPGSVSGMLNQLIVRTSSDNMAAVKDVLAELDRAPAQLLISVRHAGQITSSRSGSSLSGRLRAGDVTLGSGQPGGSVGGLVVEHSGARNVVRYRSHETQRRSRDNSTFQVRTLEGREAYISTGQQVPVGSQDVIANPGTGVITSRQHVEYRDVSSGFYATPYVNGENVTLHVSPRRNQLASGGRIKTQSANTTVSGRLGEWIRIGGVNQQETRRGSAYTYSTRNTSSNTTNIELLVERID